jgi:plastocyanin
MKATVTVVKKSKHIASNKGVKATVAKEVKRDIKIAKGLSTKTIPAGMVSVGSAGPHGVDAYVMLPANLNVKVGDTVKFQMPTASREVHTATFGPGNPETDPTSYLGQIASSFQGASLDQKGVYPSDNTLATLTPALHGNGFWNTGGMDNAAATPLPNSNSVKFGAPGTYDYYCMIHPFMHGVITVTG